MKTKPFDTLYGKFLRFCLQLPIARRHRLELSYDKYPDEYSAFAKDIIIPRLKKYPKFLVVCASDHTSMLLKLDPKLKEHITCIIDNNEELWQTFFHGIPVLSPLDGIKEGKTIFVSTTRYQNKLRLQLKSLNFKGKIIAPDDVVPAEYFLEMFYSQDSL